MRLFQRKGTTVLLTVIAGLTRNLSNGNKSSSRSGDGGCFSAMTVKSLSVVHPL